jgi:release factor glutamine methyltransferase
MGGMKVIDLIHDSEHQLRLVYSDPITCHQYAWWLLEKLTGKKKAQLIVQDTVSLSTSDHNTLQKWLQNLVDEHKPIQYILGSVPFNGIDIIVKPPTLIPRPETEEWTCNLIEKLRSAHPEESRDGRHEGLNILDLCTGSGCIAVALAKALPHATITALDIAQSALLLTQENAKHNNVANVTCIKSDLFNALPEGSGFDLIVSNPPYIAEDEWTTLDVSVTHWEDKRALVAQDHGLAIIERIIQDAPRFLKPNHELQSHHIPQLTIEIGYLQGPAVKQLMDAAGYTHTQIIKDLEGKDRIVVGSIYGDRPTHS